MVAIVHDDEIRHLIADRIVDVTVVCRRGLKEEMMRSTRHETILGNARIVLADRVIERGWVAFADGRIAEFGEGDAPAGSEDAGGDLIMPGLIELHTDHLEAHYVPRPKVFWDPIAAVVSYDGQLATSRHHHRAGFAAGLARGRRRGGRRQGRRAGGGDHVRARRRTCCAPITSCICAAKSRCRAWSRKPRS